jgi:transcriptional regulator with XRE-family HTH domain
MSDSFGDYVVRRRTELGLSRQELAGRANVSYPYVSQIETDKRVPSIKTLHELARALEVPLNELAARMSTDTWLMSSSSLPPSMALGEPVGASSPSYGDDELERYRDKLLPSLRRRLREAPPLIQVELLSELMQEAARESRQRGS